MSLPQGAQVIEVPGKTILPGLIDGHCHYQDGAGELYLAFGVTTCPDISKNSTDWIIAQREGIKNGTIRGPRIWASGYNLDGPPLPAMREPRRRRSGVIVRTPDEARKAVRELVDKGVDGLKFYERLTPELQQPTGLAEYQPVEAGSEAPLRRFQARTLSLRKILSPRSERRVGRTIPVFAMSVNRHSVK